MNPVFILSNLAILTSCTYIDPSKAEKEFLFVVESISFPIDATAKALIINGNVGPNKIATKMFDCFNSYSNAVSSHIFPNCTPNFPDTNSFEILKFALLNCEVSVFKKWLLNQDYPDPHKTVKDYLITLIQDGTYQVTSEQKSNIISDIKAVADSFSYQLNEIELHELRSRFKVVSDTLEVSDEPANLEYIFAFYRYLVILSKAGFLGAPLNVKGFKKFLSSRNISSEDKIKIDLLKDKESFNKIYNRSNEESNVSESPARSFVVYDHDYLQSPDIFALNLSAIADFPDTKTIIYENCKFPAKLDYITKNLLKFFEHIEPENLIFNNCVFSEPVAGILHDAFEIFELLPSISSLTLESCKLDYFPEFIGKFVDLKEINITNNYLSSINSDDIEMMSKVESLNLSGNMILYLGSFENLKNLKTLDLSHNFYENLPQETMLSILSQAYKAPNIENLKINNNFLVKPFTSHTELLNLKTLDMSLNKIAVIDEEFGNLPNLTHLTMQHNGSQVPVIIKYDLTKSETLKMIDFAWSNINNHPRALKAIRDIPNLENFRLLNWEDSYIDLNRCPGLRKKFGWIVKNDNILIFSRINDE